MLDLSTLNPEQREAVTRVDGPLMILAGAGTGKTRVITFRIAYMLGCGVAPEQIVALSFTNKAAREMAERASGIIGPRAKKAWLGTFHSFCLSILRAYPKAADLTHGFGLAGTSDQLDLVRRGLEEKGWAGNYQADRLHAQIGTAKNALLSPDDLRKGVGSGKGFDDVTVLAEVYDLYERQLKLNRVIDFDDCIYKTVKLLRSNAEVREALRQKYRYVMVDEYQDTNAAQLAVLEQIASDTHDVCVVGDDDQSIYSWRGAMYEVLERFELMFPGTKMIKLEQNYRCSNVILDAANTVIKNNAKRKDKTLWSASTETAPIALVPCEDEDAESRFVAEKCMSLMGAGLEPKDIGVLYRANAQAKAIELALREARIPYRTFGGQSFFERKEVKDFCCYLRLVLDHEDRLALWRVINTPQRGIGLKTLEKIEEQARAAKESPFKVMTDSPLTPAVKQFVATIVGLSNRPRQTAEDFEALGVAILKESGLENEIRLKEEGAARDRKLQNLRSLPQWLATLATDVLGDNDGVMDERALLDILTLDADRKSEKEHQRSYVSLMTIHAAKGLEFPAVFVVGCEEDYLPHKNSALDPQALCEERRLFYVALTRAKQKLFLSHCVERSGGYQFGGGRTCQPSRFLKEMPASTFVEGREASNAGMKRSEEDRKTRTASRLSSLRASLKT